MRSRTTRRFRKALQVLPEPIRRQAREAYERFRDDPGHPSLQIKKVHPSLPIFSARVSLGYRAVAVRDGDDWVWFFIGSHADYDALLREL